MKKEILRFNPENLVMLRINRGLTARALSLKLKKNESYINSIENGKSSISMTAVYELSHILKVPTTYFFIKNTQPIVFYELLHNLNKLDYKELIMVKEYVLHIIAIGEKDK